MEANKQLIAIDGNSLMHRAYYALPAMTSKEGTPTGAVHGFLSMLIKLLARKPDYLVVAFDLPGRTFRHAQYEAYKAGRRETPDDLRPQFPLLQEILRAMGIAVCTCEQYEADDILGTFSRIAARAGVDALLVTGDRDALQLITQNTHVLLTKKGITDTDEMDEAALKEAYGLTPALMRDLKGLMGDGSDNIPGIPGVGEKTALKLLHAYGSMEQTLQNGAQIKGKLGEKVLAFADQARMSYQLGIIDTAAPIDMALEETKFSPAHMQRAIPMLRKLQLNTVAERLFSLDDSPQVPAVYSTAFSQTHITELADLEHVVAALKAQPLVALHVEADCLSLCAQAGTQYQVKLFGSLLDPGLDASKVLRALAPLLEEEMPRIAVFDAKKWMHLLLDEQITLQGLFCDVMIVDYLLNATRPAASLQALVAERLGDAQPGAHALLQLTGPMMDELEKRALLLLYQSVELPLIAVLFDMERVGFALDTAMLETLSQTFQTRIGELAAAVYAHAGESFNILSTKQLGSILFEKLNLPPQKKTKTGYSTDADVLEQLQHMHPIVPLVQEYRFLTKLKSTFVDGLLQVLSAKDQRVHTSFNQNVTATGRISSTEPNLQNIPVRTALGREIRKAFVATKGNVLLGADYSQIELRLLAHISADASMKQAFLDGADIHTRTASEVFDTPPENVTDAQRSAAKAVNFGIVYGISDFGLSRNLHIGRKEAGEYIAKYLERYPGVKKYMQTSVEQGKQMGYVKTLLGRRRELPELSSSNYNTRSFGERVAMNMPIQGTAADIIKLAMVRVHKTLEQRGLQAKLILQVHDELILDVPPQEVSEVEVLLKDCMQSAMELDVPLIVDVKTGSSWYDTK